MEFCDSCGKGITNKWEKFVLEDGIEDKILCKKCMEKEYEDDEE